MTQCQDDFDHMEQTGELDLTVVNVSEYALEYVQRNLLKRVHKQDFADNGVIVFKRVVHSIVRNAKNSISNRPRN